METPSDANPASYDASPLCQFEIATAKLKEFELGFKQRVDTTIPRLNEAATGCKYTTEYVDVAGNTIAVSCLRTLGGVVTRPQTDGSKLLPCVKKAVDTAMASKLIRPVCQDSQLALDFKSGIL